MLLCFTFVTEDAFTDTAAAQTAAKLLGNPIELCVNGVLISSLTREHSLKVFNVITKEVEYCGVMKS